MTRKRQKLHTSKNKGKHLSNRKKTDIVQFKEMGITHRDIAKRIGCSEQTVEYTLYTWAPSRPDDVKLAHARALREMASKVTEKAMLAFECVTKDSMTHDRIEVRDGGGNLTAVNHSGPTGFQNASAGTQMSKQAQDLLDRAEALENPEAQSENTADGLAALLESIKGRATSLHLDIDLTGMEKRLEAAGVEIADADYEVVDEDSEE